MCLKITWRCKSYGSENYCLKPYIFNYRRYQLITKSFLTRSLAAAALVAVCGVSHASFIIFTTASSFAAATSAPGVDTYAGFSTSVGTPSPINRNAGAYTYTASTSENSFFGAGTTADPWLSTTTALASIKFSSFSGGARAIGGNFFGSNVFGNFSAGDITIVANDSLGSQWTQTITGATVPSFRGFLSTGTISSLVVTVVQRAAANDIWPTVDNLTLATAAVAPVPEPEAYALMLAGMGIVGFMARGHRGRG